MNISVLTGLVILESFLILLAIIVFLLRKRSKLKKSINELLARLAKNIFPELVKKEIAKTNQRIKDIKDGDELELAETEDEDSEEENGLKRTLTFRSTYLHAEVNAYEDSGGDKNLFWKHLIVNIAPLMSTGQSGADDASESNPYLDEIIQELHSKLDRSVKSNVSLQALLDSLLSDEKLATDQIEIIKDAQSDYYDLNQNISELENKLKNLSLEDDSSAQEASIVASEKTFFIEKKTNKINKEVNKLKDTIYEQGRKINALLISLRESNLDTDENSALHEQFEALELSQKETAMCLEVLEMENHRLLEAVESHPDTTDTVVVIDGVSVDDMDTTQLREKVNELEELVEEKDREYEKLTQELDAIQNEFMAVYTKGEDNP